MRNIYYFLIALSCCMLSFHSCENEMGSDIQLSLEELDSSLNTRAVETDSLKERCIKPFEMTNELKELRDRMKGIKNAKSRVASSNYNQYFSENMWAIRELPFMIENDKGWLSTEGKGNKVSFKRYRNSVRPAVSRPSPPRPSGPRPSGRPNTSSKFYLSIPPSITGIPYLIYAHQTNTPLGVGHYTDNPNQKIVFVTNSNSTNVPFVAWDIIPASNHPGYYVFQNEDYIGQGSSGSMWDIFNYVIEANGDDASFGRYSQKQEQEFRIVPDASFTLKNLEFINPYSATVVQRDNIVIQIATTNSSPQSRRENLEFEKMVEEDSYFEEEKGIAFKVPDSDLRFARPTVTLGEIDLIPNTQIPADTKYEPNIRKVFEKKLHQTVPVLVKPRTKLVMTYYYKVYDVSIDYVATIVYNDREAKLPGRWSGRIYVDEIFEPDFEEINLDTQRSVKRKVNIRNASQSSPLTF